jgi:hypothetical protein
MCTNTYILGYMHPAWILWMWIPVAQLAMTIQHDLAILYIYEYTYIFIWDMTLQFKQWMSVGCWAMKPPSHVVGADGVRMSTESLCHSSNVLSEISPETMIVCIHTFTPNIKLSCKVSGQQVLQKHE